MVILLNRNYRFYIHYINVISDKKFEFRSENKSAYRNVKIPLKTILKDKKLQPKIEELVLLLNDLVTS